MSAGGLAATNQPTSTASGNAVSTSTAATSSASAAATGNTSNYDIYTEVLGTKCTLPKKPPAYEYYKEPTVYAQIDHFKTMQHKSHSGGGAMAQQPTMSNSASASNAYQLHHHPTYQSNQYQQQLPPAQQHTNLQYGSDATSTVAHNAIRASNSGQFGLNNSGSNGTLSNSNTLTFSAIQSPSSSTVFYHPNNNASVQTQSAVSPASQQSAHTSTSSKQYSREIVTIRTPLLCSQQESCV